MKENLEVWAREVYNRLKTFAEFEKNEFVVHFSKSPFEILIAIILSQNTSDKNSIRAFINLKKSIGLDPKNLCEASLEELERAIRIAGLYRQKSRIIKELACKVLFGELDLKRILKMPVDDARKALLTIKGIGYKTVDVFLAIHGKKTMGVDTHARRIAIRWGLVRPDATYEEVRNAFLNTFKDIKNYDDLHKMLITLGRKWCRARKPLCDKCPLNDLCVKCL